MTTDLEIYRNVDYPTRVVPEPTTTGGVVYVASHPDLPGCMAHGDTPDEALQNLAEARELYIETLAERGLPIPLPQQRVAAVVWQHFGVARGTEARYHPLKEPAQLH